MNQYYTDQERVLLTEHIIQAHEEITAEKQKQGEICGGILGLTGTNIGGQCAWNIDSLQTTSPKSWAALVWTLYENMPLLINDDDIYTRGVARWRLRIGR